MKIEKCILSPFPVFFPLYCFLNCGQRSLRILCGVPSATRADRGETELTIRKAPFERFKIIDFLH
jgi:hypothetical protein